jgi:hypothetical protein
MAVQVSSWLLSTTMMPLKFDYYQMELLVITVIAFGLHFFDKENIYRIYESSPKIIKSALITSNISFLL